jgi:rhodanese-related sulfurtransferase
MKLISVNQLKTVQATGNPIDLIDVRTPAEFEAIHVPGARSMPLDTLDCAAVLAARDQSSDKAPIYILCHSGNRAKKAAQKFAAVGFEDCFVVEGGTQAWVDAGFPVERGERSVLPLDRQMQILMGSLVLAGVLLSRIHPLWIVLSGFVGCGMIFAGFSGLCPMRSVVAMMPWNQGSRKSKKSCCGV